MRWSTTLRPLAEAKGLTFELSMPAQDVMVRTDRRALSQILLNLTNNAIKFTETGLVRLEVDRPGSDDRAIEIRVIDTGIGIKPEDQDKLFKAFTPLTAPTGRSRRDRDSGSTSARSWPNSLAARSVSRANSARAAPSSCHFHGADMGIRILVIEDNPTNLELMTYLLKAFGHTTIAARDGEEGVEAALRTQPRPDPVRYRPSQIGWIRRGPTTEGRADAERRAPDCRHGLRHGRRSRQGDRDRV